MTFLKWLKKKPKFDTECICICGCKWRGIYEYSTNIIKKTEYENKTTNFRKTL